MKIDAADRSFCPAELRIDFFDSPFGRALIGVESESTRIVWLSLLLDKSAREKKKHLADLEKHWQPAQMKKGLTGVLEKPDSTFFLTTKPKPNLLMRGTEFQHAVWNQLTKIPCGKTLSYADIAGQLNRKKSHARAIGSAVAANTIAVLVPCHRVVRADGKLSGFRWGTTRKRMLLDWETAQISQ